MGAVLGEAVNRRVVLGWAEFGRRYWGRRLTEGWYWGLAVWGGRYGGAS